MRWWKFSLWLCVATALLASPRPARSALSDRRMHRRAAPPARPLPSVELSHLTTHDSYALRPDRASGSFSPRVMRAVTELLRCHHTGQRHVISRRLVEVLYATARHFSSSRLD